MKCPYLSEERVRSCGIAPYRKMIAYRDVDAEHELCSSPHHSHCVLVRNRSLECDSASTSCPFLQDTLAHYCAASPGTMYVPCVHPELLRCHTVAHRYCDVFLAVSISDGAEAGRVGRAHPNSRRLSLRPSEIPENLSYSRNHMWLDRSEEGCCHVGFDAFLTALMGNFGQVTFLTLSGLTRPAVAFNVHGIDLQMTFPNPLVVKSANVYLRLHPERLTTAPYTFGWLFEGLDPSGGEEEIQAGLVQGHEAKAWMDQEYERLTRFVFECTGNASESDKTLMNDGGDLGVDLLDHLSREETLRLFNEFFSPYEGRR